MRKSPKGVKQTLTSKQEITELLEIAREYQWKLMFNLPEVAGELPGRAEIFHVNPEDGFLTVGSEINSLSTSENFGIRFEARDAGIYFQFLSETLPYPGNPLAYRFASERRIAFPVELTYQQQREALRINFSNMDTISIALFTEDGKRVAGSIVDMSTVGVRAGFPGYLVDQFEDSKLITDCGIILPDTSVLKCRVEVLGTLYDFEEDTTFARCRFLELDNDVEIKIREVTSQALKNNQENSSA